MLITCTVPEGPVTEMTQHITGNCGACGVISRTDFLVSSSVDAVDTQTRICIFGLQGVILPYRHIYGDKNRLRSKNSSDMQAETNNIIQTKHAVRLFLAFYLLNLLPFTVSDALKISLKKNLST